jgi:hypothetical protein
MKKLIILLYLIAFGIYNAQNNKDSISSKITLSGYAEVFYSYDFNQPGNHIRQPFLYTYNRHHEVNLNLGLMKVNYSTENMRANLAFMAGTYPQDNLIAEQDLLKYVNEANIGFKISKTKNIWIDAGIMPSHIGWESAIGKDNLNLTRSIAAENSPYFETGAKISYTSDNGKFFLSGLVLNGWQRIARPEGNQTLAFGHQISYKFSDNFSLNSSSFFGNDKRRKINACVISTIYMPILILVKNGRELQVLMWARNKLQKEVAVIILGIHQIYCLDMRLRTIPKLVEELNIIVIKMA